MAAQNSRVSGDGNSVTQAILSRTSIRAFLPRRVERSTIYPEAPIDSLRTEREAVEEFARFRGF